MRKRPAGQDTGYSDIELGLLIEAGLATERTTICTTVHELQVLNEELPQPGHDFRGDFMRHHADHLVQ